MRNPFHTPPPPPVITPARLNQIEASVRAFLAAQAARSDVDDTEVIALAPEFAATPGTLKKIKDRIGLT